VSFTFADWLVTQLVRRARKRTAEPIGPMLAGYRAFLAS
jgi:hypothetical protein